MGDGTPVLLALEASRRGFTPDRYKHPLLACRRWLRRIGVRIIESGGQELVVPDEINRAVLGAAAPANEPAPPVADDVAAIVAAITGGR